VNLIGRIPPPAMFAKAQETSSTDGRKSSKVMTFKLELFEKEVALIKRVKA
jgi:hypothetical protein